MLSGSFLIGGSGDREGGREAGSALARRVDVLARRTDVLVHMHPALQPFPGLQSPRAALLGIMRLLASSFCPQVPQPPLFSPWSTAIPPLPAWFVTSALTPLPHCLLSIIFPYFFPV